MDLLIRSVWKLTSFRGTGLVVYEEAIGFNYRAFRGLGRVVEEKERLY